MRKTLLILASLSFAAWAAPIVELTVKERAGIARISEPVTMGVPLPDGLITDTASLALLDSAGNAMDCEFRRVSEWVNNASIRWLHLDFQATLPESGSLKVTLVEDPLKHAVSQPRLTVTDLGGKYEVTTGKIKFTVKKGGYNIIDEAWIDESGAGNYSVNQVMASHTRGLTARIAGTEYISSNDAASMTAIERRGPMALVLKSTGFLKNGSNASSQLRFVCRIYAYNNSPVLKFVYSFENNKAVNDSTIVQSLEADLPTTLTASPSFLLGAPGADKSGVLSSSSDTAWCLVSNPYDIARSGIATINYAFGGLASGTGEAMNSTTHLHETRLGWAALSAGGRGLAVAVRDFWQTNPKTVEVDGSGMCRIGIVPQRRNGDFGDIILYGGISRTHEMRFAFFETADSDSIRGLVAGMQKPLAAFAPAAWYCSGTKSPRRLIERDYTRYLPAYKQWVQMIDNRMTSTFNLQYNYFDRFSRVGVSLDAYGILDWGSTFHWAWEEGVYTPYNVSWDGQYYGLDDLYCTEFLRSGDTRWFDCFEAQSRSHMDVQIGHFGPGSGNTGACRYCPSREHVRQDEGNLYISAECNHHKNTGLFDRYYLCGDERSLEVAMETVDWCLDNYPTDYRNPGQIRGPSNYCWMLTNAYLYTKDAKYLPNIAATLNYHVDHYTANGLTFDWQGSFFAEALVEYDRLAPTAKIRDFLKTRFSGYTQSNLSPRWTLVNSYGYYLTGDTAYLHRAVECMKVLASLSNIYKDFASEYRNVSLATFYFGDSSVVPAEKKSPSLSLEDGLTVFPNPFNPEITITLEGDLDKAASLKVYDLSGRLVEELTARVNGGKVTWRKPGLASGIYVIRVEGAGISIARRIILSR